MLSHNRENDHTLAVLDALLLCIGFSLAFTIRTAWPIPGLDPTRIPEFSAHFWLLALGVPLYLTIARATGLYPSPRASRLYESLRAIFKTFTYMSLVLGTAIFLFQAKTYSRMVFGLFLLISFGLIAGVRMMLAALAPWTRRDSVWSRRLLIVGAGPEAASIRSTIESFGDRSMTILGHLTDADDAPVNPGAGPILGSIAQLGQIVEDEVVDDVLFAVPGDRLLRCESHVARCEEVGVTVHLAVDFMRSLVARTYPSTLDGIPILTLATGPRAPVRMMIKRLIDVAVSLVTLFLASPILLLCAILVRTTSAGPVLFRQQRVGLNGRLFTIYKFRSMHADAERRLAEVAHLNEVSGPVFKIRRDPRLTAIGRWMRRFSLDEFPQLWNVLKGDMSLVGPRPPIPEEVRRYERWQRRRLSMKPGLTCLWQVSGRNDVRFEDWMKLDLSYIDNWSLGLDLSILLRTVPAVISARGAN